MMRLFITLPVAALTLTLAGSAEAGPRGARHVSTGRAFASPSVTVVRTYNQRSVGVRFTYGTYYRGRNHPNWAWSYCSPVNRVCYYFDPITQTWYYWYAPLGVYYPVSYAAVAPPTPLGPLGPQLAGVGNTVPPLPGTTTPTPPKPVIPTPPPPAEPPADPPADPE